MLTESWVEGKSVVEKDSQPTERTAALWRIVKQNRFKNLGELHRNGLRLGSGIRATTHRRVKEFGYSLSSEGRPYRGAKEKKNWLLPSGPKSSFQIERKFCISFGNQVLEYGGRVESSQPKLRWSPVLSSTVWWWFGRWQCHLVLVHWVFLKTNVTAPVTKTFLSTSGLLLLTSFLKMLISFCSRIWHLPTLPNAPKLVKWPWCWCAWLASKLTNLNPIENRESMGYCQEENEKQRQKMQMSWRPLSKRTGLPYHLSSARTDHLHATPIEAVIKASLYQYWVHTQ